MRNQENNSARTPAKSLSKAFSAAPSCEILLDNPVGVAFWEKLLRRDRLGRNQFRNWGQWRATVCTQNFNFFQKWPVSDLWLCPGAPERDSGSGKKWSCKTEPFRPDSWKNGSGCCETAKLLKKRWVAIGCKIAKCETFFCRGEYIKFYFDINIYTYTYIYIKILI